MMTSKPIQSVRMDESGRDSKKHSLLFDSFPSAPNNQEPGGGGSVRRNFIVTVDSMKMPSSITTAQMVDAEKTARTNVLDGWKLTEDRQSQRRIPPDAEGADSNGKLLDLLSVRLTVLSTYGLCQIFAISLCAIVANAFLVCWIIVI